jgi:hypothetical protein
MVIHNLYFRRAIAGPLKTDPVPVIDPYAVLTFPVPSQGFKAVAWRDAKLIYSFHGVQLIQLTASNHPEFTRTALSGRLCIVPVEYIFRPLVGEGPDHVVRVA